MRKVRRTFFGLLTAPVLLQILGFGGVYVWVWGAVAIWITLSTISLAWLFLRYNEPLPWMPELWAPVGFLAVVAAQLQFDRTIDPGLTLTGLLQLVACGCILWMSIWIFQSDRRTLRLAYVLYLFTAFLAIEAIPQFFTAHGAIYWFHNASYAHPAGPFVDSDHFAGCLELLLPIATVAGFTNAAPPSIRLIRGLVPTLAVAALVMTQSRGGFTALFLEMILAICLLQKQSRRSESWRKYLPFLMIICGMTALVGWTPLVSRLWALRLPASSAYRRWVAIACLKIFRDHPLWGSGFNTFSVIYPSYQTFDIGTVWLNAHNEYAQAIAETGLLGSAAILLTIGLMGRRLRGLFRRDQKRSAQTIRQAAVIGILGFLLHSSVDFQFHIPGNAGLFFLLLGVALAGTRYRPEGSTITHER